MCPTIKTLKKFTLTFIQLEANEFSITPLAFELFTTHWRSRDETVTWNDGLALRITIEARGAGGGGRGGDYLEPLKI